MEAANGAFGACKRGEICVQTMGEERGNLRGRSCGAFGREWRAALRED